MYLTPPRGVSLTLRLDALHNQRDIVNPPIITWGIWELRQQ